MNALKAALVEGRPQIGLWQALANAYTAEICARAGFDWLLFDAEHAPNTVQTLLSQLQAIAPYPVEPVARPPVGDPVLIKQYLDIGFRSLLVPMVDSGEQARMLVSATRFPPTGIRGVASSTVRASGFGTDETYFTTAHRNICLVAQIESRAGLDAIEEIASVEGIDALFIGPGDLAAALGHAGNAAHSEVQAAIRDGLARIRRAGKPSGIFAASVESAKAFVELGTQLVSIGTDISILASGAKTLRQTMSGPNSP